MPKLSKNLAALIIILLTAALIWLFFISNLFGNYDSVSVEDPFPYLDLGDYLGILFYLVSSGTFFIVILIVLVVLLHDPILRVVTKPFLYTCGYCSSIRKKQQKFIVNGKCAGCGTYLCRTCFVTNGTCPKCGGSTFIHQKKLENPIYQIWYRFSKDFGA